MDEKELLALIEKDESETVEFKRSTAEAEKALKAACAFLNHKGGTVFFGIGKKKIAGQEVSDQTLKSISQKIRQRIKPEVSPEIGVLEVMGKKILKVKVKEGNNKLYYLDGIAYKRVGSENVVIPPDELERIILEKSKRHWDSEICEGAGLEDVDWDFVRAFFIPKYESANKKKVVGSDHELLEALGCVKGGKPTNAGILLFGKNPQGFFRNGYVALARYKGHKEGAERLDYKEFTGNLLKQIDNCDEYVKEHVSTMSRLHPYKAEREDIPEYPLFSIRELIVNAVCHRDYSEERTKVIIKMFEDRIEFYNPGGLPEEITPENIAKKQFSRNPAIAKVLSKIGYIEEMGEGWDKIIEEHKSHPLKPEMPGIDADSYTMTVTLFSTKQKFEQEKAIELNERQKQAIEYVRVHGKITNREYRTLFPDISAETARLDLRELTNKGVLERHGSKKGAFYKVRS